MRRLWDGELVDHRGNHWVVERLRLMTRPAVAPRVFVASSGPKSARLAGVIGDGLVGVSPDVTVVETFRGAGGTGKPCLAQLHVSVAGSMDQARQNAWTWWPNAAVPPSVLTELATPAEFEAVADAAGQETIDRSVVCATGPEPLIAAIDRFVAAGFDTVYLHQVGADQTRLLDLLRSELLPHYVR